MIFTFNKCKIPLKDEDEDFREKFDNRWIQIFWRNFDFVHGHVIPTP